jgi:hypothetical protein
MIGWNRKIRSVAEYLVLIYAANAGPNAEDSSIIANVSEKVAPGATSGNPGKKPGVSRHATYESVKVGKYSL